MISLVVGVRLMTIPKILDRYFIIAGWKMLDYDCYHSRASVFFADSLDVNKFKFYKCMSSLSRQCSRKFVYLREEPERMPKIKSSSFF